MPFDTAAPRTRRALLAAAAGAAAATVVAAVERPLPVTAVDDDVIQQGHVYYGTSTTGLVVESGTAFEAITNGTAGEAAVMGQGVTSIGVSGITSTGIGVTGFAGESGIGVLGRSDTGLGVQALTNTGTAVYAQGGTGGTAVYAQAGTGGYGVRAVASNGIALDVVGRARFSRSRKVTIGAGKSSLKVNLEGVTTSSLVLAVLHSNRSGTYVRAVVPSTGSFTIYLNRAVTSATFVAYFVVN